jgi:hypothetical protein
VSTATISWEKYQTLPPSQRRRPLTDAEYAALTKQQRIAAGLEDDDQGAPANFNGPVFPNPTHIQPRADTDAPIDPTRLPEGVSFQRGNWSGTPQMDVSNPAAADVQPEMGREVGAKFGNKMSAQPIDFSKYESAAPAGTSIDFSKYEPAAGTTTTKTAQPSVMQVLTQPTEKTDKEYMGYTGPAGVVGATIHGLNDVAQGTKDAIKGVYDSVGTLPQDATEKGVFVIGGPPALQTYRMLRGLGHTASDATHVAAAIHDINQSADPAGTYANAAEKTAAEGAGQALTAIGTEGVARAVPAVVEGAAPAVRATVRGINKGLAKAPGTIGGTAGAAVGGYLGGHVGAEVGGAAGAMAGREILPQVRIPGEGFGLPNRVTGGPEVAPQYEAPAEGAAPAEEPAAPLPKPKAKTVKQSTALGPNDRVQTQAQGLSQPRSIVTDPATGRPEFSDVVAAKQQAAAPVETKPAPTETTAAQPAPKPAAAETPAAEPGPSGDELLERLKGIAGRIAKQETAAPGTAEPDLTQQLQDSLDFVRARKAVAAGNAQPGAIEAAPEPGAGVMTTAAPKDLLDRWGVDPESFAEGREQTRGMKPEESAAAIADMTKRFKNGQAVEPVMETRDAGNNIIDVDGRGRALAAHQAGIERIPIVVRRMPAPSPEVVPTP